MLVFALIPYIYRDLRRINKKKVCQFRRKCVILPIFIKGRIKKEVIMEMLTILFAIAAIIGVGLVIWMKYTESGKKWVEGEY